MEKTNSKIKKYLVYYTKVMPYTDWTGNDGPIETENRVPYLCIAVYAKSADEAKKMVENNMKYSYTYHNNVDDVIELTDEVYDTLKGFDKDEADNPINSPNKLDWELDYRETFF